MHVSTAIGTMIIHTNFSLFSLLACRVSSVGMEFSSFAVFSTLRRRILRATETVSISSVLVGGGELTSYHPRLCLRVMLPCYVTNPSCYASRQAKRPVFFPCLKSSIIWGFLLFPVRFFFLPFYLDDVVLWAVSPKDVSSRVRFHIRRIVVKVDLSSSTLKTSLFHILSVHLISFILLQYHMSKLSINFFSTIHVSYT